jgi:hypothetical protein
VIVLDTRTMEVRVRVLQVNGLKYHWVVVTPDETPYKRYR